MVYGAALHTLQGGLAVWARERGGNSSERDGGGEEAAGVLEDGVPFPPATRKQQKHRTQHLKTTTKNPCIKYIHAMYSMTKTNYGQYQVEMKLFLRR